MVAQWNTWAASPDQRRRTRCCPPKCGVATKIIWYSTGGAASHRSAKRLRRRNAPGPLHPGPRRQAVPLGKYRHPHPGDHRRTGGQRRGSDGLLHAAHRSEARREIVRYYQFIRRHRDLFHANRPYAEACCVPAAEFTKGSRRRERFRQLGLHMLNEHVIRRSSRRRSNHSSGRPMRRSSPRDRCNPKHAARSRFELPTTVRVSASRPPPVPQSRTSCTAVNYNREESGKPKDAGRGIAESRSPSKAAGSTCNCPKV